jgi:putative ABC transport system permease protein
MTRATRLASATAASALRLILRLYPSRFRERFGEEVVATARRDIQESASRGALAMAASSAQAIADALTNVAAERRADRAHRARFHAPRGPFMTRHGITEDLRYGLRALVATPAFTVVAIGVLALAIGATTAIFSIVDAVVLRPLPFDDSARIMTVLEIEPRDGSVRSVAPQTFIDWQARQQSFQQLAAINRSSFRLRNERGEPITARAMRVTRDFFPLLRVQPMIGRTFTSADEVDGSHRVAILSHGFWLREFGGSRDVVGSTIVLDGQPWEVVGVMPRGFSYPVASQSSAEIFAPVAFRPYEKVRSPGRSFVYSVLGRLKDGVSTAQADDEMSRIEAALNEQYPDWTPGARVQVMPWHQALTARVWSWMLMLLGAVTLVLLIACANVANLMLVRATVRGREIGIRAALGASRWRIARGLLVEGLLLSGAAAAPAVQVLTAWLPENLPRSLSIGIDLRVLLAAAGGAVATGIGFSLAPALQSSRADLSLAFKDGGRNSTYGAAGKRLRNALIVVEVALAVVLLVGAGLFMRSFVGLIRIDPGFDYRGVLALYVNFPFERDDDFQEGLRRGSIYVHQALEAVSNVPGVRQAAAVSGGLPLSGGWQTSPVSFPGRPELQGDDKEIHTRRVSPDYLQLLRIPLKRGRYISPEDRAGAPLVVVVNEAAARHYWPDRDPLGERVIIEKLDLTVVGIVGNIRHGGPEAKVNPEAYVPLAQDGVLGAALLMRTDGDPTAFLPAAKAAIWAVNPEQRFTTDIVTLEAHMSRLVAQRRFNMALLALFGLLGLVIAAAGIYGVMGYVVAQRTSEIGVRMALGATRADIVRMILTNAGLLMGLGLAVGFMAARYLSRTVEAFLFQIEPTDPRVFAAAVCTLALSGLIASALPARRAASVDPVVALRRE